ncbi:cation/H(+) antiporter 24 isoform X2 [Punica granatum]|uniref:Uncharacterized protein n=2 Tax=Punica granatum TaxID=22663 RepID=A0A2I0JQ77_PUNGR|nr:cation/H(+) antiporter 24 isoform X2 [Punica granatum]PKI58459.1 hypothetical protein CRG98_021144 [Punica granatum]
MVRTIRSLYGGLKPEGWPSAAAGSPPQGFPLAGAGSFNNNNNHVAPGTGGGEARRLAEAILRSSGDFMPITCSSGGGHPYGFFYGESPITAYPFTLFLLEFSFIVFTIRVVRFLLKPFCQPRVIAEIVGGIIIGPSLLGHNKKFRETLFPDSGQFIIKNIGVMGFMYFLFISGVKMDMTVIMRRMGKKNLYIALVGVVLPMLASTAVAFALRSSMDEELTKISSIGEIASSLAITTFPVLYHVLKELNLLSSEVGRMALSVSICGDAIGMNAVVAFEAAIQAEVKAMNALWFVISLIGLGIFMIFGIRPILDWIIRKTPEGSPVDQAYVVAILAGVLSIGFLTDMFGIAIANGPLWLGLIIPDGPPLGSTLVERSETIVMELLMPLAFAYVGLYTDVYSMAPAWSSLRPLFYMTITGYITKLFSTLAATLFFKMPLRDSVALSLIMSLRGQVELLLFIHWIDKKIIKKPSFTLLVLLTTGVTAIATPLITMFYDPTKPYMVNKRRTIQHTPHSSELGIVMCIHDQNNIAAFINLLELSNPTSTSPFSIYALHLIELVGRAAPVFIDHQQQSEPFKYPIQDYDTIHNALMLYQETRGEFVHVEEFTTVSPMRTMYQDICELALGNKASLVILPFHKESLDGPGTEFVRQGVQSVNLKVLATAPCSVGILVDKGHFRNNPVTSSFRSSVVYNLAILFLGGADAREALVYADRMAGHPDAMLTVIRFLAHNGEGDDEIEKKLDDGVVTSFWVKNEANERVVYREVVVSNGDETVAAIRAMNDGSYDLWMVGRKQGVNPVLLEGLTSWSENRELGIIGDYVSSADFGSRASVLVVQQQVLREQKTAGSQLERLWSSISSSSAPS